jgi:CheY-like chemotaxis protein
MDLVKELRDETLPLVPGARTALENARNTGQPEDIAPLRELFHKIAGTAAPVGLPHLSRLARFGEELAVLVLTGDAKVSDATLTLLGRFLEAIDAELSETPPPKTVSAPIVVPDLIPVTRTGGGLKPQGSGSEKPQVLMIDGDIVTVKLFGKVLADHGFELKSVKSPEATPLIDEGFGDTILLDVSGGVTEASKALLALAKTRRIPTMGLSKLPREHESMATFARDVDDFLTKPITAETMVAKVRVLAERRRAVRAARSRAPTALTPGIKAAAAAPTGNMTVLVVDDSRVIRGLVREFLAESKIDVVEAEDGSLALKLLEGLTQAPSAAVIDMQMPVLDGLGLTRALRAHEKLKGLPIVLLSALDDADSQKAAMDAGANAYLVKQKFDALELRKALRSAGMAIAEP